MTGLVCRSLRFSESELRSIFAGLCVIRLVWFNLVCVKQCQYWRSEHDVTDCMHLVLLMYSYWVIMEASHAIWTEHHAHTPKKHAVRPRFTSWDILPYSLLAFSTMSQHCKYFSCSHILYPLLSMSLIFELIFISARGIMHLHLEFIQLQEFSWSKFHMWVHTLGFHKSRIQ